MTVTRQCLAGCLIGLCLAQQAQAELYQCRQADGRISYQQTACDNGAVSRSVAVDTRGPDGTDTGSAHHDYSVTAQLETMQRQREQAVRAQTRKQAANTPRRSLVSTHEYSPAKCAKQQAEVAKWHDRVRKTYRTRNEKALNEKTLLHHQELMERYCE